MRTPSNSDHHGHTGNNPNQPGAFPATMWTKLAALREGDDDGRREVLDFLVRRYGEGEAEDLVQGFFLAAVNSNLFIKADRKRGRFRSLLLGSLQNFLANARRAAGAKKRKPEGGFVSIHELSTQEGFVFVPKDTETPDEVFHRTWLRELILRVLKTLEDECRITDKTTHFELLRLRIIEPILEGAEAPSYQELAERYDLTEKEAAARVVTARRAYHRLLREEIRLFATSDEEVGAEIQDIWRFMAE
jgi:RNA polymerase sigma-70 factor (ECF subfamily)